MNIVFFHLFNDYSGSPKVLYCIIDSLLNKGYKIELVSSNSIGVFNSLFNKENFRYRSYYYRYSNNVFIEIFRYLFVQIFTFFYSFRYISKKNPIFYINTILPIGPAIAGKIMGKRIIYHYHENAFTKGIIYKILAICMQKIADQIICVSEYQSNYLKAKHKIKIIPNSLSNDAYLALSSIRKRDNLGNKNILMLSSLKVYKGILEFIQLANRLNSYKFILVINDEESNINNFISLNKIECPPNLKLYSRQDDIVPFYRKASLLLNLSNKDLFIETFGMTVLEAFTAGIPVIVPTVGGIAELVDDNIDGYRIDVKNLDLIEKKICEILSTEELYNSLKENAISKSEKFDLDNMIMEIIAIFEKNKAK